MSTPPAGINPASEADALLRRAQAAIRERGKTYGPPEEHFARTVGAINSLLADKLREPLTLADWSLIMIVDKCARELGTPHDDNATDIAGYAACLHRIRRLEESRSTV